MSRLMNLIPIVTSGAVFALALALVNQPACAQLGGVGDVVDDAGEVAGEAASEAAGAAAEAGAEGGAEAAAVGTEVGADAGAQAGAEAATGVGGAVEGVLEGATEAAGRATDAAGQAEANALTAAEIGAAIGASLRAADNRLSVDSVQQGGILANAGIQQGDEIVAIGGQRVTSEAQLINRLRAVADAGNEAIVRVRRNGQLQELTADLGARLRTAAKIVTDLTDIGVDATADSVLRTFVGTESTTTGRAGGMRKAPKRGR